MRSPTPRLLVLVSILGLATALVGAVVAGRGGRDARAQDDASMQLEVLPKSMSKADVKKVMKQWARALGVECEHCHDMDDMAKTTPRKKMARQMARMVDDINRQLKNVKGKVSCMTCHRGEKEPEEPKAPVENPPADK